MTTPSPVAADVLLGSSPEARALHAEATPPEARYADAYLQVAHDLAARQGAVERARIEAWVANGSMTLAEVFRQASVDRAALEVALRELRWGMDADADPADTISPHDVVVLASRVEATWAGLDDELAGAARRLAAEGAPFLLRSSDFLHPAGPIAARPA